MKNILFVFILFSFFTYVYSDQITFDEAQKIGMKIWNNECRQSIQGLCSWNQGEEFASLGIGHFIWYPEGKSGIFDEQFPQLLIHLSQNNVELPSWLKEIKGCPWINRDEFRSNNHSEKMESLRELLKSTINLQVLFMLQRLEKAFPLMMEYSKNNAKIKEHFNSLMTSFQGRYALLDYLNFKGDGTSEKERYNGQGWGLLQVLENMKKSSNAVLEFSESAKSLLAQRVKNSPPNRNEQKWLQGWYNRIDSYLSNE